MEKQIEGGKKVIKKKDRKCKKKKKMQLAHFVAGNFCLFNVYFYC